MNKQVLSVVLLGIFGAGFLAGHFTNPRETAGAAAVSGRKVLYYVDPMHPAYTSDRPGVAPDCGMRLEPVYADNRGRSGGDPAGPPAVALAGSVRVSPDTQQQIGMRVAAVEQAAATEHVRLYGRVVADETRSYRVDSGLDGFIRELSTVTTGSQVRKDQWLATFLAPDLRLPIQGFLAGLEILELSKQSGSSVTQINLEQASVQQSMDRLLSLGVSRPQIDDISRTRLVPTSITITAPANGFVVSRSVSAGQKFARGDELYRIADLRRVWILAEVFGPAAEHVRPGAIVRVSIPGRSAALDARVSSSVLPQFDPASQSVLLRVEADNPDYVLRPDMFVDVDLPLALPPAITVPSDAVVDSGLEQRVFVEGSRGVFEVRHVKTGWRFGERVEIVEGLAAGERVVVAGAFLLDSESRMREPFPGLGSAR